MKNQKETDLRMLMDIVNTAFSADIMAPNRDRINVNARRSFSNILLGLDLSLSEIGRYLGKDHATILHYRDTHNGLMSSDKAFRRIHTESVESFLKCSSIMKQKKANNSSSSPVHFLLKENNQLSYELEKYRTEVESLREDRKRMNEIFNTVSERTPHGSEEQINAKLNAWFNGLS
jgi:hypothetical protein